jgi:hypothetical protein
MYGPVAIESTTPPLFLPFNLAALRAAAPSMFVCWFLFLGAPTQTSILFVRIVTAPTQLRNTFYVCVPCCSHTGDLDLLDGLSEEEIAELMGGVESGAPSADLGSILSTLRELAPDLAAGDESEEAKGWREVYTSRVLPPPQVGPVKVKMVTGEAVLLFSLLFPPPPPLPSPLFFAMSLLRHVTPSPCHSFLPSFHIVV